MKKLLNFFALCGSLSTLLCCALPVTLVFLGMGASFASLTSTFPQIGWITKNKDAVFIANAVILIVTYIMIRKSKKGACPTEASTREACATSKKFGHIIFYISAVVYLIGLSFSYIVPRVLH